MVSRLALARALRASTLSTIALGSMIGAPSAFCEDFDFNAKILKASCDPEAGYRADRILGQLVPGGDRGSVPCSVQIQGRPYVAEGPLPPSWKPSPAPDRRLPNKVQIAFDGAQFQATTRPVVLVENVPGGDAKKSFSKVDVVKDKAGKELPGQFVVTLQSQATATLFFNLEPQLEFFPKESTPSKITVLVDGKAQGITTKLFRKDVGNVLLRMGKGELAAVASGKTAQKLEAKQLEVVTDRSAVALLADDTDRRVREQMAKIATAYETKISLSEPYEANIKSVDELNRNIASVPDRKAALDKDTKAKNELITTNNTTITTEDANRKNLNGQIDSKSTEIQACDREINKWYQYYYSTLPYSSDPYGLLVTCRNAQAPWIQKKNNAIAARDTLILQRNAADVRIKNLQTANADAQKATTENNLKKTRLDEQKIKDEKAVKDLQVKIDQAKPSVDAANVAFDGAMTKLNSLVDEVKKNQSKLDVSTKKLIEAFRLASK